MTYEETLDYLYNQLPVFQQIGAKAYKPGLQNSEALDRYFGYPHRRFKTIHIAGTNGKVLHHIYWLQFSKRVDTKQDYILHLI